MVDVIDYACFGFSSSVDALVFSFDGQYTKDAIYKKIERLGLEIVDEEKKNVSTTTSLELPEEPPSVEETLIKLSADFGCAGKVWSGKNRYFAIARPSWRQTKLVIRRIGELARRLPPGSKIIVHRIRR
jgi:hypothetical protein